MGSVNIMLFNQWRKKVAALAVKCEAIEKRLEALENLQPVTEKIAKTYKPRMKKNED